MTRPTYFSRFSDIGEDTSARSKSFNFKSKLSFVNTKIIDELIKIGRNEKTNARISLHASSDNALHNMIIMQKKGTFNRPHKHVQKAEAYHLLYGRQMIIIFDDRGEIIDTCMMSPEDNVIYRFEKNMFHMSIPLSDLVIFHESKIGPFVRKGDSVFPDWAPVPGKQEQVDMFIKKLGLL